MASITLVKKAKSLKYSGDVGIMNFKFEMAPEIYLPKSRNVWDSYFD